jgi:hypothetical protein
MGALSRVRCRGFAVSCSNLREEDAAFLPASGRNEPKRFLFPAKTDPAAVEAAAAASEL